MTLDLTAGIVRILRPDGTTSGAGFLISNDGLIATCSHVVQPEDSQDRGETGPEEVWVVFQTTGDEGLAKVEEWRSYDAEDVAILRLVGDIPEGVRELSLGTSAGSIDHRFQTFGFPDANPEGGIRGDGHIQGKTRMKGVEVLQISSKEVTPGFSGAPILDTVTHHVVGMVKSIITPDKYERLGTTAFVTPTETLRDICPPLKISDRPPDLGHVAFTEADAERLRRIALARQLASQSDLIGNQRGDLFPRSVLLAVEAMRRYPCLEADQALRHRLTRLAKPVIKIQHERGLVTVAFSPNGRLLATASYDNVAKIWDIDGGREIATINHDGPIYAISFSPDGTLFATASGDNTAKVMRINSGKEILKIVHRKLVFDVAFSPDGNKLATASWDNSVKVWGIAAGREIATIQHGDIIRKVAFSPDGNKLATASWDNSAKVWDVDTGTEISVMPHKHRVNSVVFSPDGAYLATSSDNNITRIWDITGKEIRHVEHKNWVLNVVFSPTGKQLATASIDRTAKVWNVATGTEIAKMQHEHQVNSVRFSPDGKLLATASEDYTASLWTIETGQEIARMAHFGGVLAVIFSPDGKRLATASDDHTATVWKTIALQEIAKMRHGGQVNSIAFSPDGTYLATASNDCTARIWKVVTGQEIRKIEHDNWVHAVIFSPNGKQLATASGANIRYWDIAKSQEIATKCYMNSPNAIWSIKHGIHRMTKTGSFSDMKEDAIDLEINKIQQDGSFKIVISSPDKKLIALASKEGIVTVRITATGTRIATMSHKMPIVSIAFSPDGKRLATTSADGNARVWNISTATEVAKMQHEHQVITVGFCPDGIHLATGSSDNTVRVWKIETGQEISRLLHEDHVFDFKFSPEGSKLATASRDGTVRVWLWRPKDLISEACSRLIRNLTPEEWEQYIPGEPYRKTCPNLL